MATNITTSQTIGPFSHEAWRWAVDATAKVNSTAKTITVSGVIRDGDGVPINDAVIECWTPGADQAEANHPMPSFRRVPSGEQGEYTLVLSMPESAAQGQPATFVTVFARGLVKHQFTAIFLEDDPGLAQSDILNQVPQNRRATLIAKKTGPDRYEWDIWMQTDRETVFFDYV